MEAAPGRRARRGRYFFRRAVHRRDLRSFPTRRSSDLPMATSSNTVARVTVARTYKSESSRSEEHTSELQSLRHLVCRLLLEKKKNKETPEVRTCVFISHSDNNKINVL